MHNMITEILDSNTTLSTELLQAEQLLTYIEAHNDERHDTFVGAAKAMNELGLNITGGDGKPEPIEFEVITDDSLTEIAAGIQSRHMQGCSIDGEDVMDLHFCARDSDPESERALLSMLIEQDADLSDDAKMLLIKAIDEVTVEAGEEETLLMGFKPDSLSDKIIIIYIYIYIYTNKMYCKRGIYIFIRAVGRSRGFPDASQTTLDGFEKLQKHEKHIRNT